METSLIDAHRIEDGCVILTFRDNIGIGIVSNLGWDRKTKQFETFLIKFFCNRVLRNLGWAIAPACFLIT